MSQQKMLLPQVAAADREKTSNRMSCCPSCVQKRSTYIPGFALLLLLVGTTYLSTLQRRTITFNSLVGAQTNCSKKHGVAKDDTKSTRKPLIRNLLPSLRNNHHGYLIATDPRRNSHFVNEDSQGTETHQRPRKTSDVLPLGLNQKLTYDSEWVRKPRIYQPVRGYSSSTYSPEEQTVFSSPAPPAAKLLEENAAANNVQKIYFKRFDKWKKAKNNSLNYFIPQMSRLSFAEKTAIWKTSLPYRPKDVDLLALVSHTPYLVFKRQSN